MATVNPSQEELRKVLQETPKDQPVVMLNLLRFRDQAAYKDDTENCSGRDAYKRYMDEAAECVRSVGAEVIWSGRSVGSLIAPPDESWDQDRKSTRLNSSHVRISYAVFCLKKKT